MIVVNLSLIGPVPPKLCSREELAAVLAVAEDIAETTQAAAIDSVLDDWELALTWRSLSEQAVDEEWYYGALLVTCLRGLRGQISPRFYTIS